MHTRWNLWGGEGARHQSRTWSSAMACMNSCTDDERRECGCNGCNGVTASAVGVGAAGSGGGGVGRIQVGEEQRCQTVPVPTAVAGVEQEAEEVKLAAD